MNNSKTSDNSKNNPKVKLLITLLIWIAIIFCISYVRGNNSVAISWNGSGMSAKDPSGQTYQINFGDTDSMKLISVSDYGNAAGGSQNPSYRWGLWKNDAYGIYHIYAASKTDCCIVFSTNDGYVVVNQDTADETRNLYDYLKQLFDENGYKISVS
ncbi:MAG: hypothetical protein LKJ76_03830 [Lachnospiraceae bacterium]|jgi:hypothetical protein|nr:hypothetical protein [Lachnospiraceae bacterium]